MWIAREPVMHHAPNRAHDLPDLVVVGLQCMQTLVSMNLYRKYKDLTDHTSAFKAN